MTLFREEMEVLKGKEEVNFRDIELEELTDADRQMWVLVKTLTVNEKEFWEYRQRTTDSGSHSRQQFCAFLANKIAAW